MTSENKPSSAGVVLRIAKSDPLPLRLETEMSAYFLDGLATVGWTDGDLVPEVYAKESKCPEQDSRTRQRSVGRPSAWCALRTKSTPYTQDSSRTGVSVETLRNWVKHEQIDEGEREGLTTEEKEGLRRLRRVR